MKKTILSVAFLLGTFAQGLEIKVIEFSQIDVVKELITTIAYQIFRISGSMEQFKQEIVDTKQYYDIENVQQVYLNNNGLFLVLLDGEKVVASGGIRKFDNETAELKRMWMLEEYRGKGWGTKIAQQLIAFAKEHGYKKIRLDVWKPEYQEAAIQFYKKLGFYQIEAYHQSRAKFYMEKNL